MKRSRGRLGAWILCLMLPTSIAAQRSDVAPVRLDVVAEKLGVKLVPSAPRELELGSSATATLATPSRLEPFGITNMHEGARVTITCVAPDRLRVEADEMEPVAQRAVVTLRINPDGSLDVVPDRPRPNKPPAR